MPGVPAASARSADIAVQNMKTPATRAGQLTRHMLGCIHETPLDDRQFGWSGALCQQTATERSPAGWHDAIGVAGMLQPAPRDTNR
jgi:hypothetical protein